MSSSDDDEKWASIAQITEKVKEVEDDDDQEEEGEEEEPEERSTLAAIPSSSSSCSTNTNGDDNNNNNNKNTKKNNHLEDHHEDPSAMLSNGRIHLKAISRAEMDSLKAARQQQRRRSRKAAQRQFFVADQQSTLSTEQMKSQMEDTTDTLTKDHIAEVLRVGKVSDKFDKLVKTPERQLTARLVPYFEKSLVAVGSGNAGGDGAAAAKVPTPTFNDFDISVEEIQARVDQLEALRKRRRGNLGKETSTNRNGGSDNFKAEEGHDYGNFSFSDFKRKMVKSTAAVATVTGSSNSMTGSIQLGKIDANFRPTVSLGTRTYTRTKAKDLPTPPPLQEVKQEIISSTTTTITETTEHKS